MTTTKKPMEPMTLDDLAAFAVAQGAYDATLRYQPRRYNLSGGDVYRVVLESQDRGSRWRSNTVQLPLRGELAVLVEPLFPRGQYGVSRTWLTLVGILKRLGRTEVAAQVKAAQDKAKAAEQDRKVAAYRQTISDAAAGLTTQLERLAARDEWVALTVAEMTAYREAVAALKILTRAVPYAPIVAVGNRVTVPGLTGTYRNLSGLVISVTGRRARVDVRQEDGTAAVREYDVGEIRKEA